MSRKHLVAIGACYVDTILQVPYYPGEDEKLRATALIKRRGGNCPNTLEVLQQLVAVDDGNGGLSTANEQTVLSAHGTPPAALNNTQDETGQKDGLNENENDDKKMPSSPVTTGHESRADNEEHKDDIIKKEPSLSLTLISTLPRRAAPASAWIVDSFDTLSNDSNAECAVRDERQPTSIDLSHCIYREEFDEPASSYILSSSQTHTRTIVNINELPEMTTEEFIAICEDLFQSKSTANTTTEPSATATPDTDEGAEIWHFHFEGRIPDTTLECIRWLKTHVRFRIGPHRIRPQAHLRISVEIEKPGREGLQLLADEADIVFYSKTWAQAAGYSTPEVCVWDQHCRARVRADPIGAEKLFICTWGVAGARAVSLHKARVSGLSGGDHDEQPVPVVEVLESLAFSSRDHRPVADSIGAGDTFIAGILWGLLCRARQSQNAWSMQQVLDFANQLAGRKVLQWGFDRLGLAMDKIINPGNLTAQETASRIVAG